LWLWHESQVPTFDTSASALYQEMLPVVPYRSARTWSFTTTPGLLANVEMRPRPNV
jgi:hypothetical protein